MTKAKKRYTTQHLLELIDVYDEVRRSQPKIRLTANDSEKTSFHTIAEMNVGALYDYAAKIKSDNPDLPDVPEPFDNPDTSATRLRLWAVDTKKILSQTGGKAETQATPETEYENKNLKEKQEGVLEPKPPEFLQNLLWICRYGRRHWKLVLLAILILLILSIFVLPKFNLFSELYRLIKNIHF